MTHSSSHPGLPGNQGIPAFPGQAKPGSLLNSGPAWTTLWRTVFVRHVAVAGRRRRSRGGRQDGSGTHALLSATWGEWTSMSLGAATKRSLWHFVAFASRRGRQCGRSNVWAAAVLPTTYMVGVHVVRERWNCVVSPSIQGPAMTR